MSADDLAPLRAAVLWMPVCRTSHDGRACREYRVVDERGTDLLFARAFLWHREILVARPDGTPCFSIRRSRLFVFNGRADVRELPSQRDLGRLRRSGMFTAPDGVTRGRFRDARSVAERSREGVFQAAAEVFLEAGESAPAGPDAMILQIGDAVTGSLDYVKLPAFLSGESPPEPTRWSRLVPAGARKAFDALYAPRGWKFARGGDTDGDPRLEIAAALFAAELSRW